MIRVFHAFLIHIQEDQDGGLEAAAVAAIIADVQNQQAAQAGLMQATLMRLGFTQVSACEFTNNGISTMNCLPLQRMHWTI